MLTPSHQYHQRPPGRSCSSAKLRGRCRCRSLLAPPALSTRASPFCLLLLLAPPLLHQPRHRAHWRGNPSHRFASSLPHSSSQIRVALHRRAKQPRHCSSLLTPSRVALRSTAQAAVILARSSTAKLQQESPELSQEYQSLLLPTAGEAAVKVSSQTLDLVNPGLTNFEIICRLGELQSDPEG